MTEEALRSLAHAGQNVNYGPGRKLRLGEVANLRVKPDLQNWLVSQFDSSDCESSNYAFSLTS